MKSDRHGLGLIFLLILPVLVTTCREKEDSMPEPPGGSVMFAFEHRVNGQPLVTNQLIYANAAGNQYMVTDLMYFISDITFYGAGGKRKVIGEWKDIFYIDEKIPATQTILFPDLVPAGTFDSIGFTFGISAEKNNSFMYVNPPEVIMGWPEVLGGGYHYMMLNGKWRDTTSSILPFNFHLGIGQLYHGTTLNVDSIYAFVHNCFTVNLPGSSFHLSDKEQLGFTLTMNIEKWFESPHVYDHNQWGGAIMQNQAAMNMARENGWDVFSIVKH